MQVILNSNKGFRARPGLEKIHHRKLFGLHVLAVRFRPQTRQIGKVTVGWLQRTDYHSIFEPLNTSCAQKHRPTAGFFHGMRSAGAVPCQRDGSNQGAESVQ